MTEDLHSTADVSRVRALLLKEQKGLDLLTGLPIPDKQAVLDHSHQTQYVRGVLHRQSNAVLGKLENVYIRYLSYWYNDTLPTFLRQAADYLERPVDTRYVHPKWKARVTTDFNSCNEGQKKEVLEYLELPQGENSTVRKKLFTAAINSKKYTFTFIKNLLKGIKT